MIVFLTLIYCAALWLLVRLGVVRLNLGWRLSPLIWMLFLLVAFFIPMQWGAPMGPVNVYQYVVEIVPNVTGEVTEVPIEGMRPLKKGDVLFQIDRTPYVATVEQLRAQLEDAKQSVKQLAASAEAAAATVAKTETDVDVAKSKQRSAAAGVKAAEAMLAEVAGRKTKALAAVVDLETQVTAAQREYDRLGSLLSQSAVSKSEVDRAEVQITGLKAQLNTAEVEVKVAEDAIARAEADVTAAEANAEVVDLQLAQLIETELPRVRALANEAELAANSRMGDQHTLVATAKAQLEKAEFDLRQTTVRAPADGMVVGLGLRSGQRVSNLPLRAWMSFVPTENTHLVVGIPQFALRHVCVSQPVEVTFKLFPGKIFPAVVDQIAPASAAGQVAPSGTVMNAPNASQQPGTYGVRLKLADDAEIDLSSLPGGAVGTAAIYTDCSRSSHIIRRVMIRMQAWMNYLR